MKPNFALNLSHEGLSLLRRATGGWQIIGSVELDDPALVEKLGYLRKTASELSGGQLASKLVIPNSEILYRKMEAPGLSDEDREQAIRLGLVGATPYAVDDLVFDWVDAGDGKALVCAVARDTLDEAESFATEHRFNPVSFVAIPDDDTFVGEPFFGETGQSATILHPGETVESDPGPIVVVGDHDPDTAPIPQETSVELFPKDSGADETPPTQIKPENDDTEISEPDLGNPIVEGENTATQDQLSDSQTEERSQFSSSRKGFVGDEDALSGLESISPRFALYPDRSRPEEISGDDEKPKPAPTVTTKSVNAPDMVGSDDIIPAAPAEEPIVSKPKKSRKANVTLPVRNPEPMLLSDKMIDTKTTAPLDLGIPSQIPKRSKTIGVSLALSLAALVLLAVLVSSIFFDRPFTASRLFGGFNGAESTLTAQSLSEPQIVATTIAPQGQIGDPDLSASDIELAAIMPVEHPNSQQALTDAEIAESEFDPTALGEITAEEALVIQSTTGVWVLAPIPPVSLEAEKLDNFYVASIDRRVNSNDAVALPETAVALNDIRLGEMASPAPAGTIYELDELGRVKPTASGAMSADGVLVFLGKPPYTPALRPTSAAGFEPAVQLARTISSRRPLPRPENLVETNERAQLGGLSRAELANRRPVARPTSPQDTHEEVDETPTQLAIQSSRFPVNRPESFAQVVTAARNAAQANAVNAAVASVASAAVAAPRVPSIPTSASVAREATVENAINLSQVNLIGVYGSSSDRRALVRLKNGRYVKVQIGDRLDGGQVAAINGNRLQYVKRGRMVTLDIAS